VDYLKRMLHGWSVFLIPPYEYAFVYKNRLRLDPLVRLYNVVFYGIRAGTGKPPVAPDSRSREFLGWEHTWTWAVLLVLACTWSLYKIFDKLRARAASHETVTVLFFLVSTLVYASVVSNMIELSENVRFRMEIEPMAWVLIVASFCDF